MARYQQHMPRQPRWGVQTPFWVHPHSLRIFNGLRDGPDHHSDPQTCPGYNNPIRGSIPLAFYLLIYWNISTSGKKRFSIYTCIVEYQNTYKTSSNRPGVRGMACLSAVYTLDPYHLITVVVILYAISFYNRTCDKVLMYGKCGSFQVPSQCQFIPARNNLYPRVTFYSCE